MKTKIEDDYTAQELVSSIIETPQAKRVKMNLKQIFDPAENKPVAFIIKGSPDPDAIASSLALLTFYRSIGGDGTIYHSDAISHPANKAMINILDIQMAESSIASIAEEYYVICDHADPAVGDLKCLLHVDHHKIEATEEELSIPQIIEYDAGSCSSIITRLLHEEDFLSSCANAAQIATALAYGIKTDTDNLDMAREKDWDAMKVLSQYINKDDLKKIANQKISPQAAEVLKKAWACEEAAQNWLYAGVGFLQETYRDSIAQVADEMMRRQGYDCVLVYGIIEKSSGTVVEGSIRSTDAGFDTDAFVKQFSKSAGGRKYKGGFQIALDFWSDCEDRELLETFVNTTIKGKLQSILGTSKKKKKLEEK